METITNTRCGHCKIHLTETNTHDLKNELKFATSFCRACKINLSDGLFYSRYICECKANEPDLCGPCMDRNKEIYGYS